MLEIERALLEDTNVEDLFNEEEFLNEGFEEFGDVLEEKSIVKYDKATMKKRLYTQSILLAAKEANDPLFTKYKTFAKKKKEYRQLINKKYASAGRAKMKQLMKAKKMLSK